MHLYRIISVFMKNKKSQKLYILLFLFIFINFSIMARSLQFHNVISALP